ncbi:unnamed protein product [Rhizophagus irregularis]|nr:unnamed protein product [Rhizophagus irregularis]
MGMLLLESGEWYATSFVITKIFSLSSFGGSNFKCEIFLELAFEKIPYRNYKRIIIDAWSKKFLNLENLETNDKKQVALQGLIDPVIDEYVIKIVNELTSSYGYHEIILNIIHRVALKDCRLWII